MAGLVPYLMLPGTAREALTRYHEIFGGELQLNSYADFGRDDGPADAIAHVVKDDELNPNFIIPTVFHPDVPKAVAAAIRGD